MGSGRTQDQAAGGFGASDDSYGSRTGGGYGDSNTRRGDDLSSGRTGGGLGMSFNPSHLAYPNSSRH